MKSVSPGGRSCSRGSISISKRPEANAPDRPAEEVMTMGSPPDADAPARAPAVSPAPSLSDLALYFLRLGATGFGGPVALANYMRRDLVERRRWVSEAEYESGLAIAAACPGPLAYQLGVYCGYIRFGLL